MSPRSVIPRPRALVEAAAKLLANQVPHNTRRLAKEIGTSPMAVYTRFGGMDELRREVRREGFGRFAAGLAAAPHTRDPVADMYMLGRACAIDALENPHLYQVMVIEPVRDAEAALGTRSPSSLTSLAAAGRFHAGDPWLLALHAWARSCPAEWCRSAPS